MYTIGELENKDHTLVISNAPNGVLVNLNFDYAVVNYTTPTSGSSPNFKPGVSPGDGSSGADSGTGKSGSGGSNTGIIAGAVGGAVGAILLGVAIWFFCCRRKRGTSHRGKNAPGGTGGSSGTGLMGMVGLGGSRSREPKPQGVRPYELEKADSASHISHLAPGHGPSYQDNRRPSSNGSSSGPRRMSIDSPPHLGSQLHTPRAFTDATLANTYQPAILDDLPAQKSSQGLGLFKQDREGSVSDASLYSHVGQTLLDTEGLTREQRDSLLQAILNNPAILNGSNTNIPGGGSYFAPSIAASSGVMPAYGRPAQVPGLSIAPSSNAVPSPIQTRHAPGFGRPTSSGDGATSVSGASSLGDNGPLPFVLDIGGAAARVRAQQAHGTPPAGVPQSVSGRGDDMASTAFPQSVDGGSVIGDPTPFPHALLQGRDRTAMTPPQSSTTAYTGLGPNNPETATPSRALLSGWNSNEKGTATPTGAGSPLRTAPVTRPAPPTLNVPQPGEGEGGQQSTPGYVRDHKIPIAMAQEGSGASSGAALTGANGNASGQAGAAQGSFSGAGASVSSNASGSRTNLTVEEGTSNTAHSVSGSRPQSRFSLAFGSRDDQMHGPEGGEVPPDYAQVLAESQHGSPSRPRPGR